MGPDAKPPPTIIRQSLFPEQELSSMPTAVAIRACKFQDAGWSGCQDQLVAAFRPTLADFQGSRPKGC